MTFGVAVGAPHVALRDLCDDSKERAAVRGHTRYRVFLFCRVAMIEGQAPNVGLRAINARVSLLVRYNVFPLSAIPTKIIRTPGRAVPMMIAPLGATLGFCSFCWHGELVGGTGVELATSRVMSPALYQAELPSR